MSNEYENYAKEPHPEYGNTVLKRFGVDQTSLLGQGRHSRVFAIDSVNILRIYDPKISIKYVDSLSSLYTNLDASQTDFETPEINEFGFHENYIFSIEKRFSASMDDVLVYQTNTEKDLTATSYCSIIRQIPNIIYSEKSSDFYGEIIGEKKIQKSNWGEYLTARADQIIGQTSEKLNEIIPGFEQFFVEWKNKVLDIKNPSKTIIHGDLFPGNLMVNSQNKIEAVIDFSHQSLLGDPILDAVIAILQVKSCNLSKQQLEMIELQVREENKIDQTIFDIYSVFNYIYYTTDNRELKKLWCYKNLERLVNKAIQ